MPSSLLSDMDGSSNGHIDADQRAMQIALELQMLGLTNDDEPNSNSFDEYRNKKSINMTECVAVPSSEHVAEIVGRQGCKIKALRAKTNTYIKTPVRGDNPVFLITGRKEDVALAKREILSAAEHFSQIRAQRKNSALSTGAPTNVPGHTTIKVRVPYRVVGLVVGPKGATIKRIQQITNTYIVTPSRDKEPVFEVTGLPDSVESARNEIQSHIAVRTGGLSDGNDDSVFNGDTLTDFRSSSIYNSSSFTSFHDGSLNQLPQRSQSTDSYYFTSNGSAKISSGNDYNPINSPFSPKGFFFSEIPSPDRDYDSHSGSSGSSFEPTPPSPSIWAPEVGSRENLSRVVGDHGGTFTRSSSITTSVITSLSSGNGRPESPNTSLRRLRSDPVNGFSAFTPFSSSVTTISSQLSPTDTSSVTSSLTNTICRPSSTEGTLNINNNNINTVGGKKKECKICYESEIVAALVPCGHNLFCMECANRIKEESSNCPVCQKQVSHVLRIFS